ncbi:MAG TPA: DNA polymerase III subunit gamma/tau [Candidatus Gastranaerophilaceae bacterium]|nr:DNA polymerase III subunit gamma/tau [Candidatus Gastranaerophilaceae bacterium]
MSEKYVPLYRKYRPQTLEEIVGQEHIKKSLANAITLNKISHAYLFTGPRGTGKTSTARILAKSLNCIQGQSVTPCGLCPSCIEITNSIPVDVIEIDAASNRKVEDARNILEKIQYVPVNGRYKIYIVDEVHMLTKEAFNTLLKTLEEPPENVIFILATTEPHKVLETITSRCQRFDFRRITTDDIIAYLKEIAQKEKINIDNDALFTIAKNSAGGMRDSLALLDQVSVLGDSQKINAEDVNNLLGRLSFDLLHKLSNNIINSETQEAIECLERIYNSGNEPVQIMLNLLGYFKNLLIVKNCTDKTLLIDLTQLNDSQIKILQEQMQKAEIHQIVFLIERISYYIKELKTTNAQHLWLEVAMIDLANMAQNSSLIALQERLSRLETSGVSANPQQYTTQPAPIPTEPIKSVTENAKQTESVKKDEKISVEKVIQKIEEKLEIKDFSPMPKTEPKPQPKQQNKDNFMESWNQFLLLLKQKSPPTYAMVSQHSIPVEFSPQKVTIACRNSLLLNSDEKKKSIKNVAEEFFSSQDISVVIRLQSDNDKIIEPTTAPVEKKKLNETAQTQSENLPEEEIQEENLEEIVSTENLPEKTTQKVMMSDQVNMVMGLFDGKYID